jgi:hypothetical protein
LHQEGQVIQEPHLPEKKQDQQQLQQQETEARTGRNNIPPAFIIEVEEEDKEKTTPKKKKAKSNPTMTTVEEITTDLAKTNLGIQASISMPVVWGHYEYNTYTDQRREVMVYKYRFLTHNFVDANDIDQLWVDERTLQVRIASPEWWENPENQAMFETKEQEAVMTDTDGNPIAVTVKVPLYDLQHKLIGSMMTNNENRKDDDGRIYDTGIFRFACDMDTADSETHVELKPLIIKGVKGQFISIKVQVDYKTVVAKKTPSKAKKATEDASIGIGPTGKWLLCVCVLIVLYCIVLNDMLACMLLTSIFILSSSFIFIIGKSIDPDGEKAFDADAYELFADMYKKYDMSPPPREELKHYSGVELNLYYLVSFLFENDQDKLQGDFVDQVMHQYEGRPQDMMKYVEGYISGGDDDDDDDDDVLEEIDPPPAGSPPLQIGGGSTPPALIENSAQDMDTTRDEKKRRHEMTVVTRQKSKSNLLLDN